MVHRHRGEVLQLVDAEVDHAAVPVDVVHVVPGDVPDVLVQTRKITGSSTAPWCGLRS